MIVIMMLLDDIKYQLDNKLFIIFLQLATN